MPLARGGTGGSGGLGDAVRDARPAADGPGPGVGGRDLRRRRVGGGRRRD